MARAITPAWHAVLLVPPFVDVVGGGVGAAVGVATTVSIETCTSLHVNPVCEQIVLYIASSTDRKAALLRLDESTPVSEIDCAILLVGSVGAPVGAPVEAAAVGAPVEDPGAGAGVEPGAGVRKGFDRGGGGAGMDGPAGAGGSASVSTRQVSQSELEMH